MPMKRFALQRL